jgi:crossover junction endodeoxyribonuclease RuvC
LAALSHLSLPVAEYTALQMKKSIAGHGKAAKAQVQEMVKRLLQLPALPGPDAADALGLAITHAHASRGMALMKEAGMGRAKASGMLRAGRGG